MKARVFFENKKISLISFFYRHPPNKPLQLWHTHLLLSTCQPQAMREVWLTQGTGWTSCSPGVYGLEMEVHSKYTNNKTVTRGDERQEGMNRALRQR